MAMLTHSLKVTFLALLLMAPLCPSAEAESPLEADSQAQIQTQNRAQTQARAWADAPALEEDGDAPAGCPGSIADLTRERQKPSRKGPGGEVRGEPPTFSQELAVHDGPRSRGQSASWPGKTGNVWKRLKGDSRGEPDAVSVRECRSNRDGKEGKNRKGRDSTFSSPSLAHGVNRPQPAPGRSETKARSADHGLSWLFETARERSLTLKMERLRAEEQAFDEKRAGNALIPNLDASVVHQRQAYVDPTPYTMFMGSQYHANVYSLQLLQRLPGLGKVPKLDREIARMRTEYQKVICTRAEIEIQRELVKLFFDLVQERDLARIDEENIRLLEKLLEVAKINRDVGLALPNDILRIEAEKANIESSLTTRRFQQENLGIDIATLLDIPAEALSLKLPDALVYPLATPDLERLLQAMTGNDPDLQLAQRDCDLVRLALDSSRAARQPTLSVNGKYTWTTTSIGQNNARDYSMGLALEMPVYDSGDLKNDLRRAERTLDRTLLARQRLLSLKRSALNKAWTDYREMEPKLRYADTAVAQSLENMRMVLTRYQHGDATIVELVDARLTMSLAAQNAVRIHRDERVRLAELYLLSRDEPALESLDRGEIRVPRMDLAAMMREAGAPASPDFGGLLEAMPDRQAIRGLLDENPLLLRAVLGTIEAAAEGNPRSGEEEP